MMLRDLSAPWAFVGLFAGIWKLVLVIVAVVLLFQRTGLPAHPVLRLLRPWSSATSTPRVAAQASRSRFHDRAFVFLVVVAATAVAALIVTRAAVMNPAGGPTRSSTPELNPPSPPPIDSNRNRGIAP